MFRPAIDHGGDTVSQNVLHACHKEISGNGCRLFIQRNQDYRIRTATASMIRAHSAGDIECLNITLNRPLESVCSLA